MVLARAMLVRTRHRPSLFAPPASDPPRWRDGNDCFDAQGELQNPRVTLYGYLSGERKELAISEHETVCNIFE